MHQFPNFILTKKEPLHVSASSSAHHQEPINCKLGTGVCHTVWRQLPSRALVGSCLQTCLTYMSAKCTVNGLLMMGRGTVRNM